MPRKFVYAPGLPGYGTRGVDGSTGLLGIATYFSAYDGNSDSVTIKSKIIANKELFSNDQVLPGYPDRVYQSGDIFIDKNARVFQVDFTEANLYKDTGIFLNTSGFFSEGPPQTLSPGFQRYSNSFETEKFLIDTVYTNSVGDYAQYPESIYGNNPKYFARVNYVGADVVPDLNGYFPFDVWTIGNADEWNAIALAREEGSNAWHFGNSDGGTIRDVSLFLDFTDVHLPGIGSATKTEIIYFDTTTKKITYGTLPVIPSGMAWAGTATDGAVGFYTTAGGAIQINRSANLTFNSGTGVLSATSFTGAGTGLTGTASSLTAGAVTNGVYTSRAINSGDGLSGGGNLSADRTLAVDSTVIRTTGNQTLGGTKTFSSTIAGSINGNAATATSATTATNLASGSNGTIPYQSAAGTTQMLATGTSGQLLRSNGAAAPSWSSFSGINGVGVATITVGSTTPAGAVTGDLWIDTTP